MKEYQSREYCRETYCHIQLLINKAEQMKAYIEKEHIKKYCKESCEAYKFHQWLNDNGYKVVKEEQ